jgi:hypothetical protein
MRSIVRTTVCLALTSACFAPIASQGQQTSEQRKASEQQPGDRTPGTPVPSDGASGRPWTIYSSLAAVYDSNINHDQTDTGAFGYVFGLGTHFRNRPASPTLEFDYNIAYHDYTATDRWDRVSHRARVDHEANLGRKWTLESIAEVSLKGSSEDRELTDQYSLVERLGYRLGRRNRVRLDLAYRVKRDKDDPDRNAINRYVRLNLDHRIASGRRWEMGARYETNRAEGTRNHYIRWTYDVQYSEELNKRDRAEFGVKYRSQKYQNRFIEIDDEDVARHDNRFEVTASWLRKLDRDTDLRLDLELETRVSNDPDRDYTANLLSATLIRRW